LKPLAEQVYEEIEQTLLSHRLNGWLCADGEGNYPLTDILTPDGESIQAGYDEIRMMSDSIYNSVLKKRLGTIEPFSMDVIRAEFEQWHAQHFIEPLTPSSGGSDYRESAVVRRWEAWQGAMSERVGGSAQLMRFYDVKTTSDLIKAMEEHIAKLQAKVPSVPDQFPGSPRHG
jgi:uncharacterized protein YyaL (SSP411 family)